MNGKKKFGAKVTVEGVVEVRPRAPGSFQWFGFWFYVSGWSNLFFLFSQTACYLWRGHRMRLFDSGFDEPLEGVTAVGEYSCDHCGQVMIMRRERGDERNGV